MLLTQPLRSCWRCRPRPALHSRALRAAPPVKLLSSRRAPSSHLGTFTSSTPLHTSASPPVVARSSHVPLRPSRRALLTTFPMTQTRAHGGHGHSHHHHHHDNVYLTSTNKHDAGVRITRIGLVANLGMAIGKFIGGYVFNSQALIADAYHALADLVSDFLTLGTVALSLKPPSERFPNGYGKVESIGALGVSSLLLCGGVLMGLNASQVLLAQFYPDLAEMLAHTGLLGHGHSHSHGLDVHGPSIHAAWLAAGSIVIKEWLYHATMKIAKERKSSVLASNAVHHRVDSLTSIVALFTIGGSYVFQDATWLDPVGGLLISLMVIKAGWANTATSLLELADTTVDPDIKQSVHKAAVKALKELQNGDQVVVRDVQGMKSGQNYLMDIELAVPGAWALTQSRSVEELVRQTVGEKVRGVKRVKIRFVPVEQPELTFSEEFVSQDTAVIQEPEEDGHEHNHEHDHDHHQSHADSQSRKKQ